MTSLEPRSPVTGWGSGGGGAPAAHAPTHATAGSDPVAPADIGALAVAARGAASGVGSLTSAGRAPTSEAPIVKHQIRTGSVTSTVTSDAGSGAGNLANLNINGTVTIGAPLNGVDWQEFEHHCVAVGADRSVSFTGGYVLAGAPSLGPFTIPRGKVLVAKSVYLGNRATAADAAAPAWGLVSVAISDAAPIPVAPAAHASTHASGQPDAITPGSIGAAAAGAAPAAHAGTHASGQPDAVSPAAIGAATAGHAHGPVVVNIAAVAAGGTITPVYQDGPSVIHKVTCSGATATLAIPAATPDGGVVNIEVYATVALTLTISASVIETGGLAASFAVAAGKVWFGALRYRATPAPGWRLLAASPDN